MKKCTLERFNELFKVTHLLIRAQNKTSQKKGMTHLNEHKLSCYYLLYLKSAFLWPTSHKHYHIQFHNNHAVGQAGFIQVWCETNSNYEIIAQSQLWEKNEKTDSRKYKRTPFNIFYIFSEGQDNVLFFFIFSLSESLKQQIIYSMN